MRVLDAEFYYICVMSKFFSLKHKLENRGWNISNAELPSNGWWASEIWRLESTWRPSGNTIYLSLMLDPQGTFDPNNPKDTNVCSVELTKSFPTGRLHECKYAFNVKRNFSKRIDEIAEAADEMRML